MADPLLELRGRIDALDTRLLKLLSERARLAQRIGTLKGGKAVYRPEREAQILRRIAALNPGPLTSASLRQIYIEIMSACRSLEDHLSVAYLGPAGTYSEQAAVKAFGGSTPYVACPSIDEVFRQVEAGLTGHGIVPVENSTEGSVGRTLDLLLTTGAKICGEVVLPIHHCFMSRVKTLAAVKRVYAHPQSLAQCQGWLARLLPEAAQVPVLSNAEAARIAAQEQGAGAIAGLNAASLYKLGVLASNIEDETNNTTRFLVIGPDGARPSGKDKTSLVLSTRNVPGAIHELLTPLARHAVSMTKLASRPARTGLWEYVFYVDVEGHADDAHVARALRDIEKRAAYFKNLGSYPAAPR